MSPLRTTLWLALWLASTVQAALVRVDHLFRRFAPQAPHARGSCPLCGSTLGASERRPPRDMRRPHKGTIQRIPAEILTWRTCTGCTRYQVGELVR